jgi:hypothetical protein
MVILLAYDSIQSLKGKTVTIGQMKLLNGKELTGYRRLRLIRQTCGFSHRAGPGLNPGFGRLFSLTSTESDSI